MHLHMTSCISVLVLTMNMGNFEISSLYHNRDGRLTSTTRCQHLTVSDEDRMSAHLSVIFAMLSCSIVHIVVYSQLRHGA